MLVHKQKVLVIGATGTQQKTTVEHLLKNGHEAFIFTRNPSSTTVKDLLEKGAKVHEGNLADNHSLELAMEEKDALSFIVPAFLENPGEAKSYAFSVFQIAKKCKIKLVVWNLSGELQMESHGDYRHEVIRYLKELNIPYILFEPTTYMENWLGPWTANYIKEKNLVSYPQLAVKKVGWMACDDMGKLMAKSMEHPELSGSHFKVSGIEAPNGDELAKIFSQALNRPLKYYALPPDEMKNVLETTYGPGAGAAVVEMYRREQADPNQPGKFHNMVEVLNKIPVKMNTIHEWVLKHQTFFNPWP
ncbi:MAG: NmrA family NAD(P)-binding protein [Bacteriovoracaceae bacterium]|nr:NmrA family NAD(P)-binding protein [Bacteriovoracaceae bacterium]